MKMNEVLVNNPMVKRIQEYATTQQHLDELHEFVIQLDNVCSQACGELKVEYNLTRKTK